MKRLSESRFKTFDYAERSAIIVFSAAAVASVLVSSGIIIVGLYEIVIELVFYFRDAPSLINPNQPYPELGPGKAVMVAGIHLVELFLLAPLPYLVARATALFFEDSHLRGKGDAHAFITVKSLIATLLIGFIAAAIAADAIEGKLEAAPTLAAAAVMLVLVGYFLVLELVSKPRIDDTASNLKRQNDQNESKPFHDAPLL